MICRSTSRFRRAVAASSALGFILAFINAVSAGPFQSYDEGEHVAYALYLSHGNLPTLRTHYSPSIPGAGRVLIYTANHPPLFYLLEGGPLRLGLAIGHPLFGFYLARLLNAALALVGVVAVGLLGRVLAPSRPAVALLAPTLWAPLPLLVSVSGQVFNDALSVTTTTLTLLGSVYVLRYGPTRGRLALLALAALSASATRATGLPVAGLAALSASASVWLHASRSQVRLILIRMAVAAVAVGAVVLGGIGWWYLRNERLYGDATGADVVLRYFPAAHIPLTQTIPSAQFWLTQYLGLFGRAALISGRLRLFVELIGILGAAALATSVVYFLRRVRAGQTTRIDAAVALLLSAHVLISLATLPIYISQGGLPYPRYLLAAMPEICVGVAWGCAALARRSAAVVGTATAAGVALCGLMVEARELTFKHRVLKGSFLGRTEAGMRLNGIAHPAMLLLALLGSAIVALLTVGVCIHAVAAPPNAEA